MGESMEGKGISRLLAALHETDRIARDKALADVKGLDPGVSLGILTRMLKDQDPDLRCDAAEALLRIDAMLAIDLVLPLLRDGDDSVRWYTCGLLHDFGDKRALASLVDLVLSDPHCDVRSTAAYALGAIGDTTVLPALRQVVELDMGADSWGHTVREVATEAISQILARA
jgi:HEAT repeat protein